MRRVPTRSTRVDVQRTMVRWWGSKYAVTAVTDKWSALSPVGANIPCVGSEIPRHLRIKVQHYIQELHTQSIARHESDVVGSNSYL